MLTSMHSATFRIEEMPPVACMRLVRDKKKKKKKNGKKG